MHSDFKFKDSIYLVSGNYELDLHNNYAFTGVHYSVAEHMVTLSWIRGDGQWIDQAIPESVALEFCGVSHFQFLPRDPEMPFTEDDCLSTVGYWTDDDWCDGVFTTEREPDNGWLRAFEFMSGATILIRADEAKAIINR